MAKRKRTDDEQKLFDQIEHLKEQRRREVSDRDGALDALNKMIDDGYEGDDDKAQRDLRSQLSWYAASRRAVRRTDATIASLKAEYDAMRARNDDGAQS